VIESSDATGEAAKVEEFASRARQEQVSVEMLLFDADSGEEIPFAELGSLSAAPRVKLTMVRKKEAVELEWQPKDVENIYLLMLE
jgi:hypothetical protein